MPLKDHKQELWCAEAIARLIKYQAQQKTQASLNVGNALKALVAKREFEQQQQELEQVAGVTWGAW
jgi:hypothetical protein